jgi:hypothetical protein
MRCSLGFVACGSLVAALMSGCGDQAVNPVWQALCEATCGRGFECFPDEGSIAQCMSDCLGEIGGAPCERPNQGAVDACVAEFAIFSCEALEAGDFPPVCSWVCSGCTAPSDCDDDNECTADSCDPGGTCINTPVANATSCGVGGLTCQEGVCVGDFPCTEQGIRDAIASGWGPHTFACEGPTTVPTQNEIVIDNNVILDGEGQLTVDGLDDHPVFFVEGLAVVGLRGFTITGGRGQTPESAGGITNPAGVLTLTRTTVSGNIGGGVHNGWNGPTMTLNETTVSDNAKEGPGAGIHNLGIMTLTNSTVSGNAAHDINQEGTGGGIHNNGRLEVIGSTVSGNTADDGAGLYNTGELSLVRSSVSGNATQGGGEGGGIYNRHTLTLTDSTVSGNSAGFSGGGIYNGGLGEATLTATNSTVSENTAAQGGGIMAEGRATLSNCTVSRNQAPDLGGALYTPSYELLVTLRNTIIDGNCEGNSLSNGYNIESLGDTCGFDQSTDQVGVSAEDLKLEPLQNNGGPTITHALGAGSFAIDQIPAIDCVDAGGESLTTDQRGEPRPAGTDSKCDVGAFELGQP